MDSEEYIKQFFEEGKDYIFSEEKGKLALSIILQAPTLGHLVKQLREANFTEFETGFLLGMIRAFRDISNRERLRKRRERRARRHKEKN